jgi:ABC-2 type transport system ATP-binding protein
LKPTGGQALIGGHDVEEDALSARKLLGYLPESAPLYDDMMVIDFLSFVAELRGVPEDLRKGRIRDACERCGVSSVLGKDIGQLSKGFRQRVGLAQALVHDPDLLILDEPTSGLDPNQIIEIRSLIRDLGRDKTVLLSTHILPEVQATCGRIIIINEGQLVADDTPQALAEGSTGAVIHLVVKNKPGRDLDRAKLQELLSHLPGVRAVDPRDGEGAQTAGFSLRAAGAIDPREAIFETVVSHDLILLDLHRERVSLEETFRRLTRADARGDNHVS